MAKKMSNKARIQQKAAEAKAKADDAEEKKVAKTTKASKTTKTAKTAKKTTKKKTTKKRTTKKALTKRQKVVWKVFNAGFKEVAVFAYPDRKKAEDAAVKAQEKAGAYHFVNAVKVALEVEEEGTA